MFTRNAATSVFEGDLKGSLEPGKLADLAVLSGDIMEVADDDVAALEVVATMVGGQAAHDPQKVLTG
jgi:predicted amidohydrolase YtcJ